VSRVYVAIFLATLSTAFLPLPEEATLLAAGYAARLGSVTLPGAVAAGLLAVLLGDTLGYVVGRVLLARLLRTRLGQRLLPQRWRACGEGFLSALFGPVLVRHLVSKRSRV
jgi:membrane protein DedA with SNARE-associated domain